MEKLTLNAYAALTFVDRLRYAEHHPDHAVEMQRATNRARIAAERQSEALTADDVAPRMWSELTDDEKRKLRINDQTGAARLINEQRERDERERASLVLPSLRGV